MTHPNTKALEAAARARWERVRANWTSQMSKPVPWERLTQFERNAYIDEDRAAVSAYLAALQETHALVPRDPTPSMIIAGVAERHGQPVPEAWSLATVNIYRAMIDAASPALTAQEKK